MELGAIEADTVPLKVVVVLMRVGIWTFDKRFHTLRV